MSDEPATTATDDAPQKQYGIAWGDEIDETRKQELFRNQNIWWEQAEHGDRIGPFEDEVLTGAEVFWLAVGALAKKDGTRAFHAEERLRNSLELDVGWLDLSLLFLQGAILRNAQLQRAMLSCADLTQADLSEVQLQDANLYQTQLQDATLFRSQMQNAELQGAQLQGTNLVLAQLQQASISDVQMQEADLSDAGLQGTFIDNVQLQGADLSGAFFDASTYLRNVTLRAPNFLAVRVADVRWGAVNLATLDGTWLPPLGDEEEARRWRFVPLVPKSGEPVPTRKRQKWHRNEQMAKQCDLFRVAVRANRQVAVAMRNQGLDEEAARFSYHAHLCQRTLLRLEGWHFWGQWLFSWFLWLIAGYGYRPGRSVIVYLASVALFAVGYFVLGVTVGPHLSPYEAAVVSLTAFHGRGFFATAFKPGDPQAGLAALEAVFGLLIEISFIATFTQRFFGAK